MEKRLLTTIKRLGPISEKGLIESLTLHDLTHELSRWTSTRDDYYMIRDYDDNVQTAHKFVRTDRKAPQISIFDMNDFKDELESLNENNLIECNLRAWRTTVKGDVFSRATLEGIHRTDEMVTPMGEPVKILAVDSEEGENFIQRQLNIIKRGMTIEDKLGLVISAL